MANCHCVVCGKPLYRRPSDLARVRLVYCREHSGQAQKMFGITEAQRRGLEQSRYQKKINSVSIYRPNLRIIHRDRTPKKAKYALREFDISPEMEKSKLVAQDAKFQAAMRASIAGK